MLGSPEKPLSDLGKISYRSFWTFSILSFLRSQRPGNVPCLDDIIKETGFKREDIVSTIHHLGMLKHWKGQYVLHYSRSMLDKTLKSYDRKRFGESFSWNNSWRPIILTKMRNHKQILMKSRIFLKRVGNLPMNQECCEILIF